VPNPDEPAQFGEQHALAELFTRLGRELSTQSGLDDVLSVITRRAVEVVPDAEHAAVSRSTKRGGFETVASTSDLPPRVDAIQYRLKHGPCVDAAIDDAVYRLDDLSVDRRWPEFGREAAEKYNIHSMLSVRLFLEDDDLIAGLNLYSTKSHAFASPDQTNATLLATHGALAMHAARRRNKIDNLEVALRTSRQIGMAMGILMSTHKVTEEQAFGLLRIASQSTHRKLSDLAAGVVETGTLELPPLPGKQAAEQPDGS
jgi:transcriptional regulator with GAF, ATPase, and Fis domain